MVMGITETAPEIKCNTPHLHKNTEIIYYICGSGILHIKSQTFTVAGGSIAVIPPETEHYTEASERLESIFMIFGQENKSSLSGFLLCNDDPQHNAGALARIIYNKYLENSRSNTMLENRLISAYEYMIETFASGSSSLPCKEIAFVKNLIMNHFREKNFDVGKAVEQSGYSSDRFRVMFKEAYKMTPLQYLTMLRINYAEALIISAPGFYKVYMLAEMCGFSDPFYFSKKYKELKGISPYQLIKQEAKQ